MGDGEATPGPSRSALMTGVSGRDGTYLAELLLGKGYLAVRGREALRLPCDGELPSSLMHAANGILFNHESPLRRAPVPFSPSRWRPSLRWRDVGGRRGLHGGGLGSDAGGFPSLPDTWRLPAPAWLAGGAHHALGDRRIPGARRQREIAEAALRPCGHRWPLDRHGRRVSVRALDDVSLLAEEGSRIGIVGGNGAGKTTLLRVAEMAAVGTWRARATAGGGARSRIRGFRRCRRHGP